MVEQPVNLPTAIYLGVFSRAERRVLAGDLQGNRERWWQMCRYPRKAHPRFEHAWGQVRLRSRQHLVVLIFRGTTMAEQPVNLSTVLYLGVFSRAEQRSSYKPSSRRLLKVTADVSLPSQCSPASSNTSKSTTRNAIAQAIAIGLLKKTERRSYCAVSLPNILTYGEALMFCARSHDVQKDHRVTSRTEDLAPLTRRAMPLFGNQKPGGTAFEV